MRSDTSRMSRACQAQVKCHQPYHNPISVKATMTAYLSDPASLESTVFVVVFVAVLASLITRIFRTKPKWRRTRKWKAHGPASPIARVAPGRLSSVPNDAAAQLLAVMAGTFTAKRVLSGTEAKVMHAAEAAITEAGLPWRVMAQVALGEVLASPDEAAFFAINAKRVDLLIVSGKCEPLAAIEYQGQGHWQGTAPARDAIKKEALRKAGIRYIEITHEHGPADVRREISRMAWLGQPKNAPPRKITV